MRIDLHQQTGLPILLDTQACELVLGDGMNRPSYHRRKVRDHQAVWARPVVGEDRIMYFYTSGLWLAEDEATWSKAGVVYGIVVFLPGVFGGEYIKSAGQYHPLCNGARQATPEIYTVLHGAGHFLLQKSAPPYETIEDAVLVEVEAGESFVVPPDYGHLQINPSPEPLVFSYTVMDGMNGVYEPFRQRRGAIYYEMADSPRYVFNPRYANRVPLRLLKAADLHQVRWLSRHSTYRTVRDHLSELGFLTDPRLFPATAHLPEGGVIVGSPAEVRRDAAEPPVQDMHRQQAKVRRRT